MSFAVTADAYDRFMGRYSRGLSAQLADLAGVAVGQTVLDVGCGPGALTGELVARVGADHTYAIDPSASFVEAVGRRLPGVDVRIAPAEALPFQDDIFDAVLAQLVVHFMTDPVAGVTEMARVARPGGMVAVSVWDHASDHGPLGLFWHTARMLDAAVQDESRLAGVREGHLADLLVATGALEQPEAATFTVEVVHPGFEEWWEPFTLGVGPAGAYVATLDDAHREALRAACRAALTTEPFTIRARAWAARARVVIRR